MLSFSFASDSNLEELLYVCCQSGRASFLYFSPGCPQCLGGHGEARVATGKKGMSMTEMQT